MLLYGLNIRPCSRGGIGLKSSETVGIIDIGSNTVRLAVFQSTAGDAFRHIDQARWSARLGRRLANGGRWDNDAVKRLTEILNHFVSICRKYCEGLLFETFMPDFPHDGGNPVLEHSIRNLNALYPTASLDHLE